jgi:hypothetical protein
VLRRNFAFLAVLALPLAAPTTSGAQTGWFGPVRVADEPAAVSEIAVGGAGEALVTWGGIVDRPLPASVAIRPAGGTFGPPQRLAPESMFPRVAVGPLGHATATWGSGPPSYSYGTASRGPGEDFGAGADFPQLPDAEGNRRDTPTAVSVDSTGTTTFAWTVTLYFDNGSRSEQRLRSVRRFADGSFGAIQEVASYSGASSPRLVLDATGTTLMVWRAFVAGQDPRDSRAFYAAASPGDPFGEPRAISEPSGPATEPHAAANRRGDVMVAWVVPPREYNGRLENAPIHTTLRPNGGEFGPVESSVPERPPPTREGKEASPFGRLALDDEGNALYAWRNTVHVLTSFKPAGGGWGPVGSITPHVVCCPSPPPDPFPSEQLHALEFDPTGNAVLVLTDGARRLGFKDASSSARGVGASVRPRGGKFSLPEPIAASSSSCCAAALDRLGNGIVTWSESSPARVQAMLYDVAAPRIGSFDPSDEVLPPAGLAKPKARRAKAPAARSFAFKLSEPARVKIVIERLGRSRWSRVGAVSRLAARGRGGVMLPASIQKRLTSRGLYRATMTARDSAGRRAKPRAARFANY